MDVASNVVVLEENQNIYDRAKRDRETAEEAEASLFAASDASDPSEASLGEMSETAARADASLAVAQASERAGAETIRAGSLLFGESAEATAAAVAGRRQRHARVLSAEETAAAQDAHDDWQRERDPAVLLPQIPSPVRWELPPHGHQTGPAECAERLKFKKMPPAYAQEPCPPNRSTDRLLYLQGMRSTVM